MTWVHIRNVMLARDWKADYSPGQAVWAVARHPATAAFSWVEATIHPGWTNAPGDPITVLLSDGSPRAIEDSGKIKPRP